MKYVLRGICLASCLTFGSMTIAAAQPPVQVLPQPPASALPCGPTADVLAHLKSKFHETPYWWGRSGTGATVLVTQAPGERTWTLLIVTPDGRTACLAEAGEGSGFSL